MPTEGDGCTIVASVSGGKDSTALILALREAGIPFRAVFADTGWEHPEVYRYLDTLRERLDLTIDVVGVPVGMRARVMHRAGFASRMQRWCTRELKLAPLRAYHDTIDGDTINAVGIRAAESESRSRMEEWSDDAEWGGFVWRPLLRWTVQDVLAMHNRYGIPVNPLYQKGLNRVGCFPCIFAVKDEIRIMAELWPERVDEIATLEAEATAERARRNEAHKLAAIEAGKHDDTYKPRYAHPVATFFQAVDRAKGEPQGIHQIVEWSRTSHGGKQHVMFAPAPTGGCMRWGMCDLPDKETQP